jgi:hypothetical protein
VAHEENSAAGLSDGLLAEALAAARNKGNEIEQKIARLSSERDIARREVELLEELLAVRRGEATSPPSGSNVSEADGGRGVTKRTGRPHPVVAAAITELEKVGRPLHISELMESLRELGVEIPGSGQQANLIAHLTRDSQIVRPSRGMYALASWGIKEKPKVKPAARRRVRGASKAATRRAQ